MNTGETWNPTASPTAAPSVSLVVLNIDSIGAYQDSTIDCSYCDGGFIVFCANVSSCAGATIICPSDANCDIYCLFANSCFGASIEVDNSRRRSMMSRNLLESSNWVSIYAACTGESSCEGMNWEVENVFSFSADCNGTNSCRNMTINSNEIVSSLDLNCNGPYSCQYTSLVCPSNGINNDNPTGCVISCAVESSSCANMVCLSFCCFCLM